MKCQYFLAIFLRGLYHFLKTPMALSYLCLKAKQRDEVSHSLTQAPLQEEETALCLSNHPLDICHGSHFIDEETKTQECERTSKHMWECTCRSGTSDPSLSESAV